MHISSSLAILAVTLGASAQYTATYDPTNLPDTTEDGQTGTNNCGTGNNQTSLCQNLYVNSVADFCLWSPPEPNSAIGNVEEIVVAWCTKGGRGTRLIPDGTLISAHFVETPDYIQVTGTGYFTNMNIQAGDTGGELDPHGADGNGNPHGGLVFSNVWNAGTNDLGQQLHEWTNLMAVDEYCIRVCKEDSPNKTSYCEHVYDINGCEWNMPGNYGDGFDSCQGDNDIPMGLYPQSDGSTSTYQPRAIPVPTANPAAATSNCQTFQSTALYTDGASIIPTGSASHSASSTGRPSSNGSSNTRSTSSNPTATNSTGGAVAIGAGLPLTLLVTLFGAIMAGIVL